MNIKMLLFGILMAATPLAAGAQTSPLSPDTDPSITNRPTPVPITVRKLILVGDSTMQVGSGWGGSFCADHLNSRVTCVDLGRGGRSTYSYRAEGSWDIARDEMKTGGYTEVYVLIQFGHNDQPGHPGRATSLSTEFPANLRRYVEETRAAGAKPVLVTPMTRRNFRNGKLIADLEPWAATVQKIAVEMHVPLIDLYGRSAAAVQAMGAAAATRLAEIPPPPDALAAAESGTTLPPKPATPAAATAPDATGPACVRSLLFDYTHLSRVGADYMSAIVTVELAKAVPELRNDLLP